jgi:hypothetical protein
MKKSICFVLAVACHSLNTYAVDGHNGIKFNMSQRQVEAKGFSCTSETKDKDIIAVCHHMDMTGIAFGYPTGNYEVSIGTNKKVDVIKVELVNFRANIPTYMDLTQKVKNFFPIEDGEIKHEMVFRNDFRANDKSGLIVVSFAPLPPISNGSTSLIFHSPHSMMLKDRARAGRAKEKAKEELNQTSSAEPAKTVTEDAKTITEETVAEPK